MIKKLFILLSVILLITTTNITVNAKSPQYAQIKNSNTYIYKSAEFDESVSNKWCLAENTYFVKILSNYNNEYYKVEYCGIIGYVKKENLTLVSNIPLMPYPQNVTFNINNSACYMRSTPVIKDVVNNIICQIPSGTKNLKYIGKIIGEEAIDFNGTIWYLTEFNGNIGYIYSGYTNSINNIALNTEQISVFNGYDYSKLTPLSNPVCVFIICVTLMPVLIILFLLYFPKRHEVNTHTHKNKQNTSTNFYDENL